METIPSPTVRAGVVFEGPIESTILGTNRTVRICLPASYATSPRRRYPVLYVHDGQNAFSTAGPNVAFGWGNWELDLTTLKLASEGRMSEVIVVAVDATRNRYTEYRGVSATWTEAEAKESRLPFVEPGNDSKYGLYKRFLIEELKPKIDREYRTKPGPASTGVIGSSMGGICSVTLAWEHPEVFGLAASMSGAFQVEKQAFVRKALRSYIGKPKPIRLYLDSGVMDYSGGDDGRKDTEAVVDELRRIGWKDGRNLKHFVDEKPRTDAELAALGLRQDKWKEAKTSQHNEFYWRTGVWRPLTFLFPPGK